jgi:phosphatidylserine/phosphatidylglycerophosphate/cardiolipin synthase-like enzyme
LGILDAAELSMVPSWVVIALLGMLAGLFIDHFISAILNGIRKLFSHGPAVITPHFSPKGGCTEAIVAELKLARHEILLQAYSFTSKEIAHALQAAATRRVKVTVLLDKSNEKESYTELGDLTGHGIDVYIDAQHAIAHNKVIVIDSRTLLTGSFNFTNQAEHENAENLLVLRNHPELAAAYRASVLSHQQHCVRPGEATKLVENAAPHHGHFRKAA